MFSLKQKQNFILYTSIAFLTGAVLYFILPYFSLLLPVTNVEPFHDTPLFILYRIFGGGYLVMILISAILLAVAIYPKLSKTIKVLSIILFMVTYVIFMMAAIIMTIPLYIYCLYSLKNSV